MPSNIQLLLKNNDNKVNYDELIRKQSWITKEDQNCILSPDSDGLLCGLFMSHYLGWKIRGFYDGKVMLIEKNTNVKDCVFLDMEVFREQIKSIGHHMVLYNRNSKPENWNNYNNCIQANNLREYDCYHDFRLKYPLATIHLLIGIVSSFIKITIPDTAICPLFFTDGTFNVLFKYPENVLNWLNFLRINDKESCLRSVFQNEKYTVFTIMKAMDNFFRERDKISIPNERGDRLRISDSSGVPFNIEKVESFYKINMLAKKRIEKFMEYLATLTTWEYKKEKWQNWDNLKMITFRKGMIGITERLNNNSYTNLLQKNPLTWAITARNRLEYTLEEPGKIF